MLCSSQVSCEQNIALQKWVIDMKIWGFEVSITFYLKSKANHLSGPGILKLFLFCFLATNKKKKSSIVVVLKFNKIKSSPQTISVVAIHSKSEDRESGRIHPNNGENHVSTFSSKVTILKFK